MSRPCPSCGADVPADTTFCPECSAYVAWEDEHEEEAAAESPRLPGEQAPPPQPPEDATTPVQPVEPVEPDVVDCPSCGKANPASRSLCQRCGASLHTTPAPAPAPPASEPSRSPRGLWIGLGLLALLGVVVLGVVLVGGDDGDPAPVPASPSAVASPQPSPTAPSPEPSPSPSPTAAESPAPSEESPSPSPSPEPEPEPTEPPFFANTEPDTEDAAGTGALTDVQVSRGDGFDQVAFTVAGPGVGWLVEYVEDPRRQGSGSPVDIDGDTVLRVSLRSLERPPDVGGGIRPTDTAAIVELVDGGWFEGTWEFFVGLDGPRRPFRMIPDDDGGALLQVDTTGTG